jgi:hypothetical protein
MGKKVLGLSITPGKGVVKVLNRVSCIGGKGHMIFVIVDVKVSF